MTDSFDSGHCSDQITMGSLIPPCPGTDSIVSIYQPEFAPAVSDEYSYPNVATCPDCGGGMIRYGRCVSCPSCGLEGCGL